MYLAFKRVCYIFFSMVFRILVENLHCLFNFSQNVLLMDVTPLSRNRDGGRRLADHHQAQHSRAVHQEVDVPHRRELPDSGELSGFVAL